MLKAYGQVVATKSGEYLKNSVSDMDGVRDIQCYVCFFPAHRLRQCDRDGAENLVE